jgi:enolase-phosphatase E1
VSRLAGRGIRAVLLDIEGTTTPIAFVHDVLFPYARTRLRSFVADRRRSPEVAEAIGQLAREHAHDASSGAPPWPSGSADDVDAIAGYAAWLMDRDRKSTGLKLLQGYIWEDGYRAGELRGQVFPDVAPALRRWHDAGLQVAIYSSGSELAQRRLFESTADGDLTPLLAGFFDTTVGGKISADSYTAIAARLGRQPHEVLFISDVARELDAARAAGLAVVLSVRPGNPPQPSPAAYDSIQTFAEVGSHLES